MLEFGRSNGRCYIAVSLSALALTFLIQSVPAVQKSEHGVYIYVYMPVSHPEWRETTDCGRRYQNVVGM